MRTDDLIKALDADNKSPAMPQRMVWAASLAAAALIAGLLFFLTIGPRPDIGHAAGTMRFLFKFVFTATLAITAFATLRLLAQPGRQVRKVAPWLALAPLMMVAAVLIELSIVPSQDWGTRMMGHNMRYCLSLIPLMGIGPLGILIAALRYGAPTRPTLSGVVAGILAGGIAATFYASHCTDDSPLFVATWYTIAITALALVGGFLGRRFSSW
jgi:hypothetical protein